MSSTVLYTSTCSSVPVWRVYFVRNDNVNKPTYGTTRMELGDGPENIVVVVSCSQFGFYWQTVRPQACQGARSPSNLARLRSIMVIYLVSL